MATETATERAPRSAPSGPDGWLGHPVAYLVTAALLVTIFGWTFFTNPGRVAPTKDPAYYTWRTELLLEESPRTLLEIEGPRYEGGGGMYSGGYRVTAPVLGGLLRRFVLVGALSTTPFLMVGIPVLTALLLGGFAFQYRRDPLIFHSVAFGAASLYLTPPFVGYLDNLLALFFTAAALLFFRDTPRSGLARLAFGCLLLLVGLTHPTTLVIFFMTLVVMAVVRATYRRFDVRSVIRDDGPALVTSFLSIVVTYGLWKMGIWGRSASLGDAALLPPYEASFFVDRLVLWVKAMRPVLNGPLLLLGAATLMAAGRAAAEDELSRVSIVWLAPLVGVLGFVAGASYPYYRFFNTTLAWVLLVGVGIWVAARFFIGVANRGGIYNLAWLGVVALVAIIGTNFYQGLTTSGWGNAEGGWLSRAEREELDILRGKLAGEGNIRPVIFVVDSDDTSPRVYGYTKLAGNTSRYGLPPSWIPQAYLYLGSLENLLAGQPTSVGGETYDEVSRATLEEAQEHSPEGTPRLVVVAAAFNETGSNVDFIRSPDAVDVPEGTEVWVVSDGVTTVSDQGGVTREQTEPARELPSSTGGNFRVILGLLLMLLPGSLAVRWLMRDASFPEWLALAPALGVSIMILVTIALLSVTRSPLGRATAWIAFAISTLLTAVLARRSNPPAPDPGHIA